MSCEANAGIVRKWFEDQKWKFSEKTHEDGVVVFRTSVSSDSEVYSGFDITLICRDKDVQSLFFPPVRATQKRYAAAAEYIARVNYRFRIGKLTMDYRDGEIRWETVKTGADLLADRDDAMDDLIGFPGFVMDKFMPGMAAVLMGFKTAEQAFEDCDKDPNAEEPPELPPDSLSGAVEGTGLEALQETMSEEGADTAPGAVPGGKGKVPAKKTGKARKAVKAPSAPKKDVKPAKDAKKGAENAQLPRGYSLKGLNIEGKIPLDKVVAAVKKFRGKKCAEVDAPRLNILLSGAPGSGKTAFAKYLATQVDAPLRTVRASELLSRYVGETEQKLANVFKEAKATGAILFLDEIDSFLQNREGASHTWEVTQVNELLQQMESFDGVMIGDTNFAENLDKAVLRRFTYKLKLDYLTNEGKGIFFRRYFKTPLTTEQQARLDSIENLTPGDFRTVKEELYYLSDKQTNDARLNALEAESEAKGKAQTKIGF